MHVCWFRNHQWGKWKCRKWTGTWWNSRNINFWRYVFCDGTHLTLFLPKIAKRYFQENRAVTAKKLNIFIKLRSFQIYMVKSDKISVFREKSDDVIKYRSRDPMKHMLSKLPHASVYSCQVWRPDHLPMGFSGGGTLCSPHPSVLSNSKKPRKCRVKSSIVLSPEISLLWIILWYLFS